MLEELERIEDLGAELSRRANAAGALLVWRAQALSVRGVVVRAGRTENTSVASLSGHGVQVLGPDGYSALGSRDDFLAEPALDLLERTLATASRGAELGLARSSAEGLAPVRGRAVPCDPAEFAAIDLGRAAARLVELERELLAGTPGVQLRVAYRATLDAWRIQRSDGTDVLFAMPRCTLTVRATGGGEGARHGVSASVFRPDPGLLWDDEACRLLLARGTAAARLATTLSDAPAHPAGSFPIVIDYALAKGLAHEAFGHAAEADGFRSSILARNGRFRGGEAVGAEHVSIIDEPVPGDHAWQPYSANGLERRRAVVVDHGRLRDGLSDPWSAAGGGVRLTAAARAESFRHAPQPRMTNIRIETDEPLAAPGRFEDYSPHDVRALLAEAGVLRRHPRVTYLSGYSGGQVNTATGDFMFQCKAIYELGEDKVELFKPAIFSGSMFGALRSIRESWGPLVLDAIGYCGKWGQSVPSSGGSHYFLMLEPDPSVRLGGS